MCVREKIALHKQLKEWAQGNSTKLLFRTNLQDIESQQLLTQLLRSSSGL